MPVHGFKPNEKEKATGAGRRQTRSQSFDQGPLSWQYMFPSSRISVDPRSVTKGGDPVKRRHHMDEGLLQLAVKKAVRAAQINKPASCYTLRHSFATHLEGENRV